MSKVHHTLTVKMDIYTEIPEGFEDYEIRDVDEINNNIMQMICDEVTMSEAVMTYEILDTSIRKED